MSLQYCPECDRMIDTDYFEFEGEICQECAIELTNKQEDLVLTRREE